MNKNISNNLFMKIASNESVFYFEEKEVKTPIGFDLVASKFFNHAPATADEIEYAINYVEDEIEKIVPILGKDRFIVESDDSFLTDIALLCGEKEDNIIELHKDKIEYLFGLYAEVSQGRVPFAFQTDLSPVFYAQLLILREYVHHLKFDILKIHKANNL